MEEKDREDVALFRYGLIAPLLNGSAGNIAEYVAEMAIQTYDVPVYGPTEYSPKTIRSWLSSYKKHGFEGLKPRLRSDKGAPRVIPAEIRKKMIELRKENTQAPVTVFYEQLAKKGLIKPQDMSYSSVYRFLKGLDLVGRRPRKEPERKRFAMDKVNAMWQIDLSHGPHLKLGRKKAPTYLQAFIDDASRLVPFGGFDLNQSFDALRTVMEEALKRRGIPATIYTDNAKIYRSKQFQYVCASLGIALIHAKPYDPQAKGKIERFFRTVRQRFYTTLEPSSLTSLEALNAAFAKWLEEDYNGRIHSAIDMTPLDAYMSQASQVKMVNDPESLRPLFLRRETRKVKHDSTISIQKQLFEVPPKYIGFSIEVRFEPGDLSQVFVYENGNLAATVTPVNLADNAKMKREKPSLRLSDIANRKED